MDKHLRDAKLDSLRRTLARIVDKRPGMVAELIEDYDLQDILCVNLERAVQICVDLSASLIADLNEPPPGTMGESFELLCRKGILTKETATQMKKAVGLRNIAVHRYQELDWQIVYNVAHHRLSDFESFAKQIVQATEGSGGKGEGVNR